MDGCRGRLIASRASSGNPSASWRFLTPSRTKCLNSLYSPMITSESKLEFCSVSDEDDSLLLFCVSFG